MDMQTPTQPSRPKREYPSVRPVGRMVLCLALPPVESGTIWIAPTEGRIKEARVLLLGEKVPLLTFDGVTRPEFEPGVRVRFDPYRIRCVYSLDGWHGESCCRAYEDDIFLIDWEDLQAVIT